MGINHRVRNSTKALRTAAAALAASVLLGCAGMPGEPADTYEAENRAAFRFNKRLDQAILKPVADGYVKVTPAPVRRGVSNFFDNATYPDVILNSFLQGKGRQGFADSGRFLVNTTIGVLGIFDVATPMGLDKHNEDFGQTLGVWGSGEGEYIVFPFLGPSSERDAPGWLVSYYTNLMYYVAESSVAAPLSVLQAIDARARARGAFEYVDRAALDPYTFIREAYRQRRTYLIYDGEPPRLKFFDEPEDNGAQTRQ